MTILLPFFVILLLICAIVFLSIYKVPQNYVYIIERMGTYHESKGHGLYAKLPFVDRIASRISMEDYLLENNHNHPVITLDNKTLNVSTSIEFRIIDPVAFTYGVENASVATELLVVTTLRNHIGTINSNDLFYEFDLTKDYQLSKALGASEFWGVKIISAVCRFQNM